MNVSRPGPFTCATFGDEPCAAAADVVSVAGGNPRRGSANTYTSSRRLNGTGMPPRTGIGPPPMYATYCRPFTEYVIGADAIVCGVWNDQSSLPEPESNAYAFDGPLDCRSAVKTTPPA